jgi:ribonuclease HI
MSNEQQEWLLMVDGASRGNPGDVGCGAAICDENGVVVKELSRYLGRVTNNVAEYDALIELGRKKIRVQCDSQLLVPNSTATIG